MNTLFVLVWALSQSIIDRRLKQQTFISHHRKLASPRSGCRSGEGPPPGVQMAAYLLHPHMAERVRKRGGDGEREERERTSAVVSSSYKNTDMVWFCVLTKSHVKLESPVLEVGPGGR